MFRDGALLGMSTSRPLWKFADHDFGRQAAIKVQSPVKRSDESRTNAD
jgi:hypothetical protein